MSTTADTADTADTVEQLDRRGTASHEVYTAGFYAGDWDFAVRSILGKSSRGGADAGVRRAARRAHRG